MNNLDISSLPEHAKQEIIDFYDFLQERYLGERQKKIDLIRLVPRKITPFTPLSREQAHER